MLFWTLQLYQVLFWTLLCNFSPIFIGAYSGPCFISQNNMTSSPERCFYFLNLLDLDTENKVLFRTMILDTIPGPTPKSGLITATWHRLLVNNGFSILWILHNNRLKASFVYFFYVNLDGHFFHFQFLSFLIIFNVKQFVCLGLTLGKHHTLQKWARFSIKAHNTVATYKVRIFFFFSL